MVKHPVGEVYGLSVHRNAACIAAVHGKRIKNAEKTRKKTATLSSSPQACQLFADVLLDTGLSITLFLLSRRPE
jgi:hypothetical protein